jgi:hypothetical protein
MTPEGAALLHSPAGPLVIVTAMAHEIDLAQTFAERCAQARAYLRREMDARGLREEDGWRIAETLRGDGARTEVVMRPIHLQLDAPDGLECVVEMHEDESIDSHCES